jgi:hypothetical protein
MHKRRRPSLEPQLGGFHERILLRLVNHLEAVVLPQTHPGQGSAAGRGATPDRTDHIHIVHAFRSSS